MLVALASRRAVRQLARSRFKPIGESRWQPIAAFEPQVRCNSAGSQGRKVGVIVHGGAWSVPDELVVNNVKACQAAAAAAYELLSRGGNAMDAVEAAVRTLEDDTSLNAGRGSSLNSVGEPECDAMIMDGSLQCGAVAGVQVLNPVSLARNVMEQTEHIMMIGEGAMRLAAPGQRDRDLLVTEASQEEWRTWTEYKGNVQSLFARGHDTVGCVAFDSAGHLACGTSTGGVVGKLQGRVGDSPLIGSGGYADDTVGAASTTGHGEAIAKVTLARLVLWLMESGRSPTQAAEEALETMRVRGGAGGGGHGGLIVISNEGEIAKCFTTQRMPWASIEGSTGVAGSSKSGIERSSLRKD